MNLDGESHLKNKQVKYELGESIKPYKSSKQQ